MFSRLAYGIAHATKMNSIVTLVLLLIFVIIGVTAGITVLQSSPTPQHPQQEVADNIAPHPAPKQPVPYSHKTHLALGLQCQACHTNPEPGNEMTFPATGTCKSCHNSEDKDKPDLITLAGLLNSDQPIPWERVYKITPGVTWSHRVHLQAGMQCVMCHGDVSQFDAMAETTAVTAMASCISCHKAHNASNACQSCHAWPLDKTLGLKK